MLILMVIAAILFYAGLFRYAGRGTRSEGSSSPGTGAPTPGTPVSEVPAGDAAVERLTWTALDDLQLNRLLREPPSSQDDSPSNNEAEGRS